MNDTSLPPELEAFSTLLSTLPAPTQMAFHYCLCLMMVEAGKMYLLETLPGDAGPVCVFESLLKERFTIPKPPLSADEEAQVIAVLREILQEEGWL